MKLTRVKEPLIEKLVEKAVENVCLTQIAQTPLPTSKGRGKDWNKQYMVGHPADRCISYEFEDCRYCEGSGRLIKITKYEPYEKSSTE